MIVLSKRENDVQVTSAENRVTQGVTSSINQKRSFYQNTQDTEVKGHTPQGMNFEASGIVAFNNTGNSRLPIDEEELEGNSPGLNKLSPENTILSPIVNSIGQK